MALEARGFTRPGRRTLLWAPADSASRRSCAGCWCSASSALIVAARRRGAARDASPWPASATGTPARRAPSLLDIDLELRDGAVVGLAGAVGGGQDDAVPGRQRPRAADHRRPDPRPDHARRRGRRRLADASAQPAHRHRLPEPGDPAVAGGRHGLRGGRLRTDEPRRCRATRSSSAPGPRSTRCASRPSPSAIRGASPAGQQQLVAIAGLLAMRPEHLVLDEPTAQLDPAGTRLVGRRDRAAGGRGRLASWSPSRRPTCWPPLHREVVVLADGRIALRGSAGEVLADPRLAELGVPEPSAVRLRRAALAAGIDAARLDAALRD